MRIKRSTTFTRIRFDGCEETCFHAIALWNIRNEVILPKIWKGIVFFIKNVDDYISGKNEW